MRRASAADAAADAGLGPAAERTRPWVGCAHATDLALSSGTAGTRVRLGETWSARAELEVRAIDPFHGNVAE
jgi:hypothetical protein